MDYGVFDVPCTRGCTDIVRESALKVYSVTKIPFRKGESNLSQLGAGPTLWHLNYIPVPPSAINLRLPFKGKATPPLKRSVRRTAPCTQSPVRMYIYPSQNTTGKNRTVDTRTRIYTHTSPAVSPL